MKKTSNPQALQEILNHWLIGSVKKVISLQTVENLEGDLLETNQGEFELYSYPATTKEASERVLAEFLENRFGWELEKLPKMTTVEHSGRVYLLLQLSEKHLVKMAEAVQDLNLLVGERIEKAFRVYGSIFQIHLHDPDVSKAIVLVSDGWWGIYQVRGKETETVVEAHEHSLEALDQAIEAIAQSKPSIVEFSFQDHQLEFALSNGMILRFWRSSEFPAIEVHFDSQKNNLHVFDEEEIYSSRDFRDKNTQRS